MASPQKALILGCASTGAKFTPQNHALCGDPVIDAICSGKTIKTTPSALIAEAIALYKRGCRYYHVHARNPDTHEQATDNHLYRAISGGIQRYCPSMLISFGASRNGREVQRAIQRHGEWERVSQCSLSLREGGAHFVTIQAAVELQIICDLERQGHALSCEHIDDQRFLTAIRRHIPSHHAIDAKLTSHSTTNGSGYGTTSPLVQFEAYRNAILTRNNFDLLHEVEWVQLDRSHAMTRYAIEHPALGLGNSGQLNITLLFGFSPRLPFPKNYQEFQTAINRARSLAYNLESPSKKARNISIAVGAAVLPQHAIDHFRYPDVGRHPKDKKCALRRLAIYAAQPDSGVDIVRYGMEDTPYAINTSGVLELCDNQTLHDVVEEELLSQGATLITERRDLLARIYPTPTASSRFYDLSSAHSGYRNLHSDNYASIFTNPTFFSEYHA